MTDTEAIALRANSATPGPWQPYIAYSGESGTPDEVGIYAGAGTTHHGQENTVISDWTLYGSEMLPDLEFMAAARTDIPELLARVRELEGALRRIDALPTGHLRRNGCASPRPWTDQRQVHQIARSVLGDTKG